MKTIQFKYNGPTVWSWSFEEPETDALRIRDRFTVLIERRDATHWKWSIYGLYSIHYDDTRGKADSMRTCLDAVTAAFKQAGIEVSLPHPEAN